MSETSPYLRRAYRHWYEDGIGEIGIGIGLMVYSLYFLLAPAFMPSGVPAVIVVLVVPVVVITAGIALLRAVVTRLKARISYPRTGYVAVRPPQPRLSLRKRLLIAFTVVPLFSVAAGLVVGHFSSDRLQWGYLLQAAVISAGFLDIARRTGLLRFALLATLVFLAGTALTVSGITDLSGIVIQVLVIGLGLIVSGAVTLVRYLRQHQPVRLEEME